MKPRAWAAIAALVVVAGCVGEFDEPSDSVSAPPPSPTTSATPSADFTVPLPPPPPPEPPAPPEPEPEPEPASECDPNYSGVCVPIASDVDCAGGSGDGPEYVDGPVYVEGEDIYGLDNDGNGVGCES